MYPLIKESEEVVILMNERITIFSLIGGIFLYCISHLYFTFLMVCVIMLPLSLFIKLVCLVAAGVKVFVDIWL